MVAFLTTGLSAVWGPGQPDWRSIPSYVCQSWGLRIVSYKAERKRTLIEDAAMCASLQVSFSISMEMLPSVGGAGPCNLGAVLQLRL